MLNTEIERKYVTIGEVVNILRPEFTDLSISKIRFLEEEGLLKPFRTSGGYRKFSQEDVNRLRLILKLQREKYLPLGVIKQTLKNLDTRGTSLSDLIKSPQAPAAPKILRAIPVQEAPQVTGLSMAEIEELEKFGIISSREGSGGKIFEPSEVEKMNLCREFSHFGIQSRHLKMYQNFAEREASFLEQILLPLLKQKNPEGRRKATQELTELVEYANKFKELMLLSMFRNYFEAI